MDTNMEKTYTLQFYKNINCQVHFHTDIEIIYVMEGQVCIQIAEEEILLGKDDIILVNSGRSHALKSEKENVIVIMHVRSELILELAQSPYTIFMCNTAKDKERSHFRLRKTFGNIICEHILNPEGDNAHKLSVFYELADCLLKEYMTSDSNYSALLNENTQIEKLLQYINQNYRREIRQSELCKLLYLSPSGFSRYFKKNIGMGYISYLTNIRLQSAMMELRMTSKSITDIALENGFTTPSAFNKIFRESKGATPSEYRKGLQEKLGNTKSLEDIIARQFLKNHMADNVDLEKTYEKIELDVNAKHTYQKVWNKAVNVGYMSDMLSAKLQSQILYLKETLGINCVRISNVFDWKMHIREKFSLESLNYDYIDSVLDFLVSNEITPVLDIIEKSYAVLRNTTTFVYNEKERPFYKDEEDFCVMLERFIEHILRRYENNVVKNWIFEIWKNNKYDINSNLGEASYVSLFEKLSHIIKYWIPEAKVGGYGLAIGEKMEGFMKEWLASQYPPDFISIFLMPYMNVEEKKKDEDLYARRVSDLDFLKQNLKKMRKELECLGSGHLPIYVTEWNLSLMDRNYENDSCGKAARMLHVIANSFEDVDFVCYSRASDITSLYYESNKPLFGGKSMLTKDGLRKPVFYIFLFLKKLGNQLIYSNNHCIVTESGKNNYYMILFNNKNLNYTYYQKEEDEITIDDIGKIYDNDDQLEVEIILNHVDDGKYYVKRSSLNEENSLLMQWRKMGELDILNLEELDYLQHISMPRIEIYQTQCYNGILKFSEILQANEIELIHIFKAR